MKLTLYMKRALFWGTVFLMGVLCTTSAFAQETPQTITPQTIQRSPQENNSQNTLPKIAQGIRHSNTPETLYDNGLTKTHEPAHKTIQEAAPLSRAQALRDAWTVLVYFENDLFFNEDRYYTNAVQLRVISPDLSKFADNTFLPQGVGDFLGDVPFPGTEDAVQYNISLGLGQHIYTPENTDIPFLQKDDRPYAGYLYGTLGLHAKKKNRLDTLELAAGIIGPSALSEQAQNEVHRLRDFDTAKGWDHQLKDEPVAMLTWSRSWRLNADSPDMGWGWDVLPRMAVSVGTPFTQASLGGEIRMGWNLPPDFGSSTIRPGAGIFAPTLKEELEVQNSLWDSLGIYLFLGVEGKAVAYNSFLDGNLWKSSHSVDKFPFVGEFNWGVGAHLGDFSLTFTHVHRTLEFHGQDTAQNFGSITVGYSF